MTGMPAARVDVVISPLLSAPGAVGAEGLDAGDELGTTGREGNDCSRETDSCADQGAACEGRASLRHRANVNARFDKGQCPLWFKGQVVKLLEAQTTCSHVELLAALFVVGFECLSQIPGAIEANHVERDMSLGRSQR